MLGLVSGGSLGLKAVDACRDSPSSWGHPSPWGPCRPAPHGKAQPLAPLPVGLGPGGSFSGANGGAQPPVLDTVKTETGSFGGQGGAGVGRAQAGR